MNKYSIELSEDQMHLIANCLEDISRFANGQWQLKYTIEELLRGWAFEKQIEKRDIIEALLKEIKKILMPELPDNASKGYNGSEFIGNTYQIYKTILHQLAIDNNWNNIHSSPVLPSGTMGSIKITKIS